jgi:tetratricopeptide (TPR) repeat protein
MNLIYWTLLVLSGLTLFLVIFRRYQIVKRDTRVQKAHAEEEAEMNTPAGDMAMADGAMGDESGATDETENGGASSKEGQAQDSVLSTEEKQEAPKSKKSPRQLFIEADTNFKRGQMEEAENKFLMVIDLDPKHLEAHHKLGMLHMKSGNFPQAELYFGTLVGLKKDPIYFSNLGAALYQQQRLREAATAYENAIALDAKRGARLQSLAQVYHELDEDELALKYFEMAIRRKPKDLNLLWILSDYYERLERWEDAMEMLRKIAILDPYNESVQGRLKDVDEARA